MVVLGEMASDLQEQVLRDLEKVALEGAVNATNGALQREPMTQAGWVAPQSWMGGWGVAGARHWRGIPPSRPGAGGCLLTPSSLSTLQPVGQPLFSLALDL